ncbi:MAG: prolyl oligopeptidase family serine peptidase [Halobacteriales archaeon]
MPTPPATDREPIVESLHGETVEDPYRWLEADEDRVADWEARQNAYTDAVLDGGARGTLAPTFEALGRRERYFLPTARGGRYFQRIADADAEQPRLTVREALDDEPRTLVSPADDAATTAVQWFEPDWNGERLVYGVTDAGTEQYDLHVLDVDAGDVVDRVEDVGRSQGAAWDGDGFYYTATGSAEAGGQLDKALRYHAVGGDDRLVTDDFPAERWPMVQTAPTTDHVLVAVGELARDAELYHLADDDLEPVLTGLDAPLEPLLHAGRVYALTTHDAPRGRLLGLDVDDIDAAGHVDAFRELVPERDDVLVGLAPAGDGLAIHRLRDASSVVSVHDADGGVRHELSLPEYAGVETRPGLSGSHGADDLFVHLTGFDRPPTVVHADVGPAASSDDWRAMQVPTVPEAYDPRGELELTVERLWAESTDGADVPVYVVHRADLEPDGDAPTVLYGYGGFRIPVLPSFDPYRLAFLADGGVYAQACLRGGLEFGETWHEAGAREHKEHTFEDFAVAARHLIDAGYTSADGLAAWGRSNGGLTVGVALTRYPELFAGIVCAVPLLDMLRFHRFLLGRAWTGEYGSPEAEDEFEWLRSYSPYHHVEDRPYPATLFTTAAGDTRVHPAHARKMTARVQHRTTGDAPICFRSVEQTGHGVGTPTSLEVEQMLDEWAFVYEALGVDLE